MGVTGLWQILHPCARPIKLETLNRKRLAVDASIWIYQFLKAVRDKEGNALRNSHVVGFFRRICKLLFFGIKPVFVFDGGAPVLKRQTVTDRKKKREGRREDAVRTAGKLLAVQMQRRAEEEELRRKESNHRAGDEEEAVPDDALVYVEEIGMSQKERQQTRKFRRKDAYHLPELDVSMNEMGGPDDLRIMSLEDLQAHARQFEAGEDINVYDFSKIDYDSPFFMSLPASDRYNILNAARLRSRLRMGHSKEQLDTMFPDRMAFSKFQIERVTERNELTQRLMHLNETGDALFNGGGRVAGEKGREYVLVKNDGVEGGWALGVISDEGTKRETAIDVDKPAPTLKRDEDWEDEDEFEDVPIEGLNRLPKRSTLDGVASDTFTTQRRAFYGSRKTGRKRKLKRPADPNSLFIADEPAGDVDDEWEDANAEQELFDGANDNIEEEDEDLRRAIAMSLQQNDAGQEDDGTQISDAEDQDMLEVFHQSAAPEAAPLPKGSGRAIANMVNKRAFNAAPESREVTSFGVPRLLSAENSPGSSENGEGDTLDLQAALAESRRTKPRTSPPPTQRPPPRSPIRPAAEPSTKAANQARFSGPLPFEKLDLGTSLLGKKKMQERSEEAAGGFINPDTAEKEQKKSTDPLPPWFTGDPEEGLQKQRVLEKEELEKARALRKQFQFDVRGEDGLMRDTREVIDLNADEADEGKEEATFKRDEVIDLESVDDTPMLVASDSEDQTADVRMDDLAEKVLSNPPTTDKGEFRIGDAEVDTEPPHEILGTASSSRRAMNEHVIPSPPPVPDDVPGNEDENNEPIDWSESEDERAQTQATRQAQEYPRTNQKDNDQRSRSPSADFEDVAIPDEPITRALDGSLQNQQNSGADPEDIVPEDEELIEFDEFSDPEDEELLRQLTLEAEEHARFASTLNKKSQAQNAADYETELKQLRNQQKKDRRDADEVTHIMISECQQLLRLFGLPYITAPMEAEAQCAELVNLGLVDGIVTDDSDCFLFGGTRIYKNMFNQAKFVECYLTSDLEKEFDLTREKLIQVAQLLGSDYTEGLPGVGPVTALEILSEFSTLQDFRDWWSGVQMNTIPKSEDSGKPFRKKFRRNATKLFLPPSFPDVRVDLAYQEPEVDSDPEAFQWGVPDLDALRTFLMATIGWSQERTDEVLVPVIRDMNRRADEGTQSNITAFFDGGVGIGAAGATKSNAGRGEIFAPRKKVAEGSKRMGSALARMAEKAKRSRDGSVSQDQSATGDESPEQEQDTGDGESHSRKKKTAPKRKRKSTVVQVEEDVEPESDASPPQRKKRMSARQPAKGK